MTQSFTFREPVSHDLGAQPTMQHYNLMPNDGVMLEKPGQKRRREISDFGLMPGNDSGTGPPTVSGTTFCDLVAAQPSLAIEKQSFLDRMIHSARSGRFPLTGAGGVTPFEPMVQMHNVVDPAAAAHVARFRPGRTLESTAAATAQAMANFQALIDEGRRSSNLFQAYENGQSNHGFGAPTFRSLSESGQANGPPSFRSLSENGPQSNHGYGAPSIRSMQNGAENGPQSNHGYGAPSIRSMQNGAENGPQLNYGYGAPRFNSLQSSFSSGIGNQTGFGGANTTGHMNGEAHNWPNLTCQTTSTRSLFDSATPQSPCTPRYNNNNNTVLSDAQQEYLNHMEQMNALATDPESPYRQRGRRLSYAESDVQIQAEKHHVHIFLDPVDQAPEHVDDWGSPGITEFTVGFGGDEIPEDAPAPIVAPAETEKFDLNEVPVGNLGEAATPKPRKKYHPRVAKDKRTYKRRVDGKKTPASPAVDGFTNTNSPAKSKSWKRSSHQRQYDAINDELGRDAASHPEVVDMDIEYNGSSYTCSSSQHNTAVCDCEACIKLRLEKRMQQQSPESPQQQQKTWHDQSTTTTTTFSESPPVRRTLFQPTPQAPPPRQDQAPEARRSLACFDLPQQNAARPDPEAARRSLACFDTPQGLQPRQDRDPDARRSLACFNSPPQQTAAVIPHHSTAYSAVKSFFTTSTASSCLQQFNESAALLGLAQRSLNAAIVPANRVGSNNSSFMSRLCPRGILSPQTVSFREMNQVQRIVYLRAILSSSNQLMMSPESLLRHVHEHLPESEKQEFKEALWPIVLSDLTSDQEKQLRDYAQLERQAGACTAIEVVKRRGPNKVKKSPQAVKPKEKKGRKSHGMEMVPYENKSLVPYEGPFDPLRKKKNRAKVVLDDETVRVWKLLMGKNGSERMQSDAEKEVKWEEERRKMKAQAQNFIERMHIVMGDRSFSKWKGSVVDSVVGAFLTQNVNDVLSSSAFMSMRSRFPGHGFRNSSEPEPPPDQDQSLESEVDHPPPSPPPPTSAISLEAPSSSSSSSSSPPPQNSGYPPVLEAPGLESRYEILAGAASTQEGRGLELCCQKELECTSVVTSEELSREMEVVATDSLPSHGKYNPKTGLTGLERAQIEEKQVSARKDFDFSALQDEFKPRVQGQERLAAPARTAETQDGVDWEAVRRANVAEVADVIKERGLNWILAGRIKAFLERIHLDYGALDLEWLRSMSTDQTKDFLLSIRGLGLKSVECIRLLTLHHLAFPVDTNVGRICVRLGWVPLEPLPEELQLHLLEMYPVQATIQKYLWPRLCKFDHKTLYELHYQMISFGKVFCTKTKPNCNACPMRPECKHFASALSSAKLALPASERPNNSPTLALPPGEKMEEETSRPVSQYCQPIIEEPMTPESEVDAEDLDIEDYPFSVQELIDEDQTTQQSEIDHILSPVINEAEPAPEPASEALSEDWGCLAAAAAKGNKGNSPNSVIEIVDSLDDLDNFENPSVLVAHSASQEMVLVAPETASLPVPKLKNVGRLRTVHYVYELPDNHPLLDGLDPRESDDPCTYLLAIWGPGEVPESIPNMNDSANDESGPFASAEGEESIKATLLVPCRTAMRGSFPLNGTYFQVNEVFADHASSLQPMLVPRTLLWNLRRRFVFFGTSVTSIFRGMTAAEIQACFWRGYVCVRGFDRSTRAPKPLVGRLHLQAGKAKGANMDV